MNIQLPDHVNFFKSCGYRLRELKALENELNECSHGLRAFQKLPRNMQRRTVSSNSQRLPRYLIDKHKREVGDNVKKNKRPCRKYRRRPGNLLAEYNRRTRNNIWLETHIWHVKRFHMISKWGYSLAHTPTAKAYRPSLRAATETSLIQDVSYECCFEIEGPLGELKTAFTSILSNADFLNLMSQESKNGRRWLQCNLYKQNKLPFQAIGDAQLLWITNPSTELPHKLWLWVHPSIYEETLGLLIEIFSLEKTVTDDRDSAELLKTNNIVTNAKIASRNIPFQRTTKYSSASTRLVVLKDTFVKFRLIGPQSLDIMKKVFKPTEITLDSSQSLNENEADKQNFWWVKYYSNPLHSRTNEEHLRLWNSLTGAESNRGRVLSFIVRDPRVILPQKKIPLGCEEKIPPQPSSSLQEEISSLAIFNSKIRDAVTMSMKTCHEINTLRSNIMVPGSTLALTKEEDRLPVLLLERPSSHVSELGAGWDVVLPAGWGTQTLVCFVLNGAAVGGQREEESLKMEFLIPPNPHQLPDTAAGQHHARIQKQQREEEYFKRPPKCRLNFIKLGIKDPFGIDWLQLIKKWDSECHDFYVFRDKLYLEWLALKSCKKLEKVGMKGSNGKRKLNDGEEPTSRKLLKVEGINKAVDPFISSSQFSVKALQYFKGTLLYVRLVLLSKGSFEPFAWICLPSEEDLKAYNNEEKLLITEQAREDNNCVKRKEAQAEQKRLLKYLKRIRKKARENVLCGKENPLANHKTMREALTAAVQDVEEKHKTIIPILGSARINAKKHRGLMMRSQEKKLWEGGFPGQRLLSGLSRLLRHAPEDGKIVEKTRSHEEHMRKLWLETSEEQTSIRPIMGYLTHGGFCNRIGRSGALGYVVSQPLLNYMHQLNLLEEEDYKETSESRPSKQILVLVRNPSSFLYRWARLVVLNV